MHSATENHTSLKQSFRKEQKLKSKSSITKDIYATSRRKNTLRKSHYILGNATQVQKVFKEIDQT